MTVQSEWWMVNTIHDHYKVVRLEMILVVNIQMPYYNLLGNITSLSVVPSVHESDSLHSSKYGLP